MSFSRRRVLDLNAAPPLTTIERDAIEPADE